VSKCEHKNIFCEQMWAWEHILCRVAPEVYHEPRALFRTHSFFQLCMCLLSKCIYVFMYVHVRSRAGGWGHFSLVGHYRGQKILFWKKISFSDIFMFLFVNVTVVYCVFISSCMSSLEVELVGVVLNVFFWFVYSQFRSNQSAWGSISLVAHDRGCQELFYRPFFFFIRLSFFFFFFFFFLFAFLHFFFFFGLHATPFCQLRRENSKWNHWRQISSWCFSFRLLFFAPCLSRLFSGRLCF